MPGFLELELPWWELVLRGAAVYVVLLTLMRLSGKRTVGEFTPFDLLVVILLGEAVGYSLMGGDTSLPAGLVVAAVLVGLNWLVGFATARSRKLDRIVEGSPVLVARDGQVYEDVLRRQSISPSEFEAEMRASGCGSRDEIQLAVVEPGGHISIVRKKD